MDINYWVSLFSRQGYKVKDAKFIPQNGVPAQGRFHIDGHHLELKGYGSIELIQGMWRTPETKLTIFSAPPETYLG